MRISKIVALAVACAFALPAIATTWGETTVDDPMDGRKCKVLTWGSFGNYIYSWPEKYDQVFWPYTDSSAIWACPSGFASFIQDTKLTEGEKDKIKGFLASSPVLDPKKATLQDRLMRMESIYALRDLGAEERLRVLRALAYQHEAGGNQGKAAELRATVLGMIESQLADATLPRKQRMEYLFVGMNYLRERGDAPAADARLDALKALIEEAEADASPEGLKLKDYSDYLKTLLEPAQKIAPGGVLAPDERP